MIKLISNKDILKLYKMDNGFEKFSTVMRFLIFPFKSLEKYIPKKGLIVDLGCGQGLFSNLIALKYPKTMVVGIDIDDYKLKLARSTIKERTNIEFIKKNLLEIDIEKEYQGVSCFILTDTLSSLTFENQRLLLEKCYNALNDDGSLIIVAIDKKPRYKYWISYLQSLISYRLLKISIAPKFYHYTSDELKKILKEIGFEVKIERADMGRYVPFFLCYAHKLKKGI